MAHPHGRSQAGPFTAPSPEGSTGTSQQSQPVPPPANQTQPAQPQVRPNQQDGEEFAPNASGEESDDDSCLELTRQEKENLVKVLAESNPHNTENFRREILGLAKGRSFKQVQTLIHPDRWRATTQAEQATIASQSKSATYVSMSYD